MWPACSSSIRVVWRWTGVGAPACLALLSSCFAGDDGDRNHDLTVRSDSAGVEIVSNLGPLWSDAQGWRIGAEPNLQIGHVEGAADDILHEVTAIRALEDTILVAQQAELRLYHEDGSFIRRMGRAGRGPGEFFQVADILRCGDTIYASEQSPPQLIVFEPDGRPRTVPLPQPETQGLLNPLSPLLACTPEGVIGGMSGPLPEAASSPGVQRRSGLVVHVRSDGGGLDTLITFPGPQTYMGLMVPFGRRTLVAALDTLLYLAETGDPEIRVLGVDGTTRRVIRLGMPVREVTSADVERIRAQYLAGHSPSIVAELQALLEAVPVAATMPYFSQLKVAADGTVWLQYYQPFRDEEVTHWTVVDSAGAWLGDVVMPEGFSVHQVHGDSVIGTWRDELGVEFIRRYTIQK